MDIYVQQDGADFYVYHDSECKDLILTRTYPHPVGLDLRKAEAARKWFTELCSKRTTIHWPNPFAESRS